MDKNDLCFYVRKDNPEETRRFRDIEGDFTHWKYDDFMSDREYEDFKETLITAFTKRFQSFLPCNKWIERERYALLENKLFFLCVQDNEWSVAVELIAKDNNDYFASLAGLQAGLHQIYLDGMRDCLFEQFASLGIYAGPWTSGRIKKPDDKGKGHQKTL